MLKPLKLYLDGWLSYDKATIPLDVEGITQLKGVVGSGKSAIYEAVFYLLFNETLRKKSSVKDLANKILANGYEAWLEFENNGYWYKVKEVRDREGFGFWFWKGSEDDIGLRLGKTNPETKKLVIKELGMSSTEFKSISFLGQRQLQVLIGGTNSDRGRVISQLFGIEELYDDAIKECESDLKDALTEKKTLTGKIADLETDLISIDDSLTIEEPIEGVDPAQMQKLKEKKENIEAKLEKIREKEADIREIIGKYNALKESKEKYNKLNAEIAEFEKKLKDLPKSGATTKDIDNAINDYREKQATIKAEINTINNWLQEIQELGELCPIDKKDCPEKRPETFRSQREENWTVALTKQKKDMEGVQGCLKTWKAEKEKKQTYDDAEKDLNDKIVVRAQCLIQDLPDIEKEKEALSKCAGGRKAGKDKLETVNDEINSLENKESLKKQQEEFKAKVERTLKEKKESIEKTKKSLTALSEDAEYLSATSNILKRLKNYKIDVILDLLNENLGDQLRKISNDQYIAKIESQKKDSKGKRFLDSFNILVYNRESSIWLPVEMVSGGQESQTGLAFLFATWKTAFELARKSCSTLFLDEVFGPLDNNTCNMVLENLCALSKELDVSSIKLISHRELNSAFFDHVWNIIIENGISSINID